MRKYLLVISTLAMITVNALANTIPFNLITTGEVSSLYPNLFTPASVTFSIWGAIYFLLVWGTIGLKKIPNTPLIVVYCINTVANAGWLIAWHYQWLLLGLMFMIVLLITLIVLVKNPTLKGVFSTAIHMYLAWIMVATIANVTIVLSTLNLAILNQELFYLHLILPIGAVLALITAYTTKHVVVMLVFIWAYSGILLRHTTEFISISLVVLLSLCLLLFILYAFKLAIKRSLL